LGLGEKWNVKRPETIDEYRDVRNKIWRMVEDLVAKLLAA